MDILENREDIVLKPDEKKKKKKSPIAEPPSQEKSKIPINVPKVLPLDAKQAKIAKGEKRGKGDYPTMDDVLSDWDSKKEEKTGIEKPKTKREAINQSGVSPLPLVPDSQPNDDKESKAKKKKDKTEENTEKTRTEEEKDEQMKSKTEKTQSLKN